MRQDRFLNSIFFCNERLQGTVYVVLFSLLILFTLLLRLPSLPEPLGSDQSLFAYVGGRILQGAVPYRDVWGNNPPGIFYLYSLILVVFGKTAFAVRLADLLCSIAVMVMIFVLSRRMFGEKTAFIAAFIYGLFSANYYALGSWWANGQSESFMMLPIIGGVYCLAAGRDKSDFWLFVAGALCGLAFLIKTVAGFVFAGLLLFLFASSVGDKAGTKTIFKKLALLIGGFVAIQIPVITYFYFQGALEDLIGAVFVYNYYYLQHPFGFDFCRKVIFDAWSYTKALPFLFIPGFFSVCWIIFRARSREDLLLLVWFLSSLVGLLAGKHLASYHHIPLVAPISILSAYSANRAISIKSRKAYSSTLRYGLVVALFLWGLAAMFTAEMPRYRDWYFYVGGYLSSDDYLSRFNAGGVFSYLQDYRVSEYMRDHTSDKDCIFVWGSQSGVYFLSGRRNASRYIFHFPFLTSVVNPPTYEREREKAREALMEELRKSRPKYFIISTWDYDPANSVNWIELVRFPELFEFLETSYVCEKQIGKYFIHRLR